MWVLFPLPPDCRFNCHRRCEPSVLRNCPGERKEDNGEGERRFLLSLSVSHFSWFHYWRSCEVCRGVCAFFFLPRDSCPVKTAVATILLLATTVRVLDGSDTDRRPPPTHLLKLWDLGTSAAPLVWEQSDMMVVPLRTLVFRSR